MKSSFNAASIDESNISKMLILGSIAATEANPSRRDSNAKLASGCCLWNPKRVSLWLVEVSPEIPFPELSVENVRRKIHKVVCEMSKKEHIRQKFG